jgi:hypothetical protein
MKIYANKYKLDSLGYDSCGQYYGHGRFTQLYEVRIETADMPLGVSTVVRVDDYGWPNKRLRSDAIKKALPELRRELEKLS